MRKNMHKEILSEEQANLLPLVKTFSKNFGLVGGTAIALHIGHRESLDFDLFSLEKFNNGAIRRKISKTKKIGHVSCDEEGQFTFLVDKIKFTFLHYPFKIFFTENFGDIINLPDLPTLASMKAYTLGRRGKWKDYVDLYFILKDFFSFSEIANKAKEIFKNEFNEKIFRSQISYFNDINYDEEIIFKKGFETDEKTIKKALIDFSLQK